MKIEKIITIIYILTFGFIYGSLNKEIILKTGNNELNFDFVNAYSNLNLFTGIVYPVLLISFFLIIYRFSIYVFMPNKKIENLSEIIILATVPSFLYTTISLFSIIDLSSNEVKSISLYKSSGIIPFLSYDASVVIANVLFVLPALILFSFLIIKKKESFLNSFFVSILPVLLIFLLYSFL